MENFKINKNEKKISEKNFGYTFSVIFLLLGIYPVLNSYDVNIYLIAISLAIALTAFYFPKLLKWPTRCWQAVSILLNKYISPVVLFLVYLITVLPINIILRIFRIDIINKNIQKKKTSYWINRKIKINDMKNQF